MRLCIIITLVACSNLLFAQTADFNVDNVDGCSPVVVQFTDLSTGPVTTWHWDFGNGNTSVLQNPSASYVTPGDYTVTLTVSDGGVNFDTLVQTNLIHVFFPPDPSFTATPTAGCLPVSVSFTNTTTPGDAPIANYVWDFGDGNFSAATNPVHPYANSGLYSITLNAADQNGCQSNITLVDHITIADPPIADFSSVNNQGCVAPMLVTFNNLTVGSPGVTYVWDFGDNTSSTQVNPVHAYTTFGTFDVTLIANDPAGCSDTITYTNHVQIQNFSTDFSASTTSGCVGVPISFTDLSTGGPTSWTWDFGDANGSTQQNPNHVYSTPGVYTVTLTSSNPNCGDMETKVNHITISASPTANFTVDTTQACSPPLAVSFTDASVGAVGWNWDFGDANTSMNQNPNHTYMQSGVFDVSLTVTGPNGCTNTLVQPNLINIIPPTAGFTPDTPNGCVPHTVNFMDASVASFTPIVSWQWFFGDGGTSMLPNPSHTYVTEDDFTVTLIVTDAEGCFDTLQMEDVITTGSPLFANFEANDDTFCLFDDVIFTNLSDTSANAWMWDFGDGGTSGIEDPMYQYGDTGIFDVTLTVINNGCRNDTVFEEYIFISGPDAMFNVIHNCDSPNCIQIIDASLAPDLILWYIDTLDTIQGTYLDTFTYCFPQSGIYNITQYDSNFITECMDIENRIVNITSPVADFSVDTTDGCVPHIVNFYDSSFNASTYFWEFGDGGTSTLSNPLKVYSSMDTFSVSLSITDIHGCRDSIYYEDLIYTYDLEVGFYGDTLVGCVPMTTNFFDTSTVFGGTPVSWTWDFGDGNGDTVQNPTHTYTTVGPHTVSLRVRDNRGCSRIRVLNNYVLPTSPNAHFTSDTFACVGSTVNFASVSSGMSLSYHWEFGDGDTSNLMHPSHAYDAEGTYSVTLTVTDVNGCVSTTTFPNWIRVANPIAHFGTDTTFGSCPPLVVNFFDSSLNHPVQWNWDLGDGTTSTLQNPSHLYTQPGVYDITLIVTNSAGCIDTAVIDSLIVLLGPNGQFDFNPKSGCIDLDVEYGAVTTNAASITWDFGDGNVLMAGDTVIHTYTNPGVFHPVMILDDGVGCIFTIDPPDSVIAGHIVADFDSSDNFPCDSGLITFTDLSFSLPDIQSWTWDFGDGSPTSAVQNPTHNYTAPGSYDVSLIIDNGLCADTLVKPNMITVHPSPVADFIAIDSIACIPATVNFQDLSTSDSSIISWNWDFGDASNAIGQNQTHDYLVPGTYTVTLAILTAEGCTDTISKDVIIHALPTATASPDTSICPTEPVRLIGGGGSIYAWSPNQFITDSTLSNPVVDPVVTTIYTLVITDTNGCTDTASVTVQVDSVPFTNAGIDIDICIGDTAQLMANNTAVSYQWTPDYNMSCDTCFNPFVWPTVDTTYTVLGVYSNGCRSRDSVRVNVHDFPEGIALERDSICNGEDVQLTATGGGTYSWSPGGSLSCTACPNPVASPSADTDYFVTVTSAFGCETIDTVSIDVFAVPVAMVSNDTIVCGGQPVRLLASGGTNYLWYPAAGLSCTNCPNPLINSPVGNQTYFVGVTNILGCGDTASVNVTVEDDPTVDAGVGDTICNGSFAQLNASGNANTYSWSPVAGLNNSTILNPTAAPTVPTMYVLTGTSVNGCTSQDSVYVHVIYKLAVSSFTDTTICIGQQVRLSTALNTGGNIPVSYNWTPGAYLDDPTAASPMATPLQNVTYTLFVNGSTCIPDTQVINVQISQPPNVDAGPDQTVISGTEVLLEATGSNGVTYNWSPEEVVSCVDCEQTTFVADVSRTLTVLATNQFGCSDSDQVVIFVIDACENGLIFVPNTFTPNNDQLNDFLRVRGIGIERLEFFRVFDRWGKMIFEATDLNDFWDGTFKGKPMDPGVFVYHVRAICTNGDEVDLKGNAALIR